MQRSTMLFRSESRSTSSENTLAEEIKSYSSAICTFRRKLSRRCSQRLIRSLQNFRSSFQMSTVSSKHTNHSTLKYTNRLSRSTISRNGYTAAIMLQLTRMQPVPAVSAQDVCMHLNSARCRKNSSSIPTAMTATSLLHSRAGYASSAILKQKNS